MEAIFSKEQDSFVDRKTIIELIVIYLFTLIPSFFSSTQIPVLSQNLNISILTLSNIVILSVFGTIITLFIIFNIVLKNKIKPLKELLKIDSLTGFLNRGQVQEIIEEQIRESKEINQTFAVIFVDIDNFREINKIGYEVGNHVMEKLKGVFNIREKDHAFRCGNGDEFLIVTHLGNNIGQGEQFADIIRERVEDYDFNKKGGNYYKKLDKEITICCGVTTYNVDETYRDLLKKAATACNQAKKECKKNCVRVLEKLPKEN